MTETMLPLPWGTRRQRRMALFSVVALVASYLFYARETTPSGSTVGGLIYGTIGFVAILVLMLLGIRRRRYASRFGTLQGWVTAHIYLGLLTALVIPLHAGFRFGWDVHTLAYALLVIVVASGIVGVGLYRIVPAKLTAYEAGVFSAKLESEVNRVASEMQMVANGKSRLFQRVAREELDRGQNTTSHGWRLLFQTFNPGARLSERARDLKKLHHTVPAGERQDFSKLSELIIQKTELESQLAGRMRFKNLLEVWLYVHVPASIALLVAVGVHLWVVLFY